jgi:hypothetical protein
LARRLHCLSPLDDRVHRNESETKERIMSLRKILIAAAVAAPLSWMPAHVAAQDSGLDQAVSTQGAAQAESVAGWTHKKTPKDEKDLPEGVAVRFADQTLPPGMTRTRPSTSTSTTSEAEPEPEPTNEDTCSQTVVFIGGLFYVQDCNGNLTPL